MFFVFFFFFALGQENYSLLYLWHDLAMFCFNIAHISVSRLIYFKYNMFTGGKRFFSNIKQTTFMIIPRFEQNEQNTDKC